MTDNAATNGRSQNGRFSSGNRYGQGNPSLKRAAELRAAMMQAITPEDISEVVSALVKAAKSGDIQAAKLVLDRCLGRITTMDDIPVADSVLGPVTTANLAQHKAALLAELDDPQQQDSRKLRRAQSIHRISER